MTIRRRADGVVFSGPRDEPEIPGGPAPGVLLPGLVARRVGRRVAVAVEWPAPQRLGRSQLRRRLPRARRVAASLTGIAALLVAAVLASLLPTPKPSTSTPAAVSTPSRGG